jgi:hypothetical protein
MAKGGTIKGSTYHNWGKGFANGGSVKKKANGGPVSRGRGPSREDEDDRPPVNPLALFGGGGMGGGGGGGSLPTMGDTGGVGRGGDGGIGGIGGGAPAPTAMMAEPAPVAAPAVTDITGGRAFKKGGTIKKRQMGGPAGTPGLGPQGMQPRRPFTPGAVPGQRPGASGARPPVVPLTGGRPTRPGYKDGGPAKKADGGRIKHYEDGDEVTPEASGTSVPASPDTSGGFGLKGAVTAAQKIGKLFGPSSSGSDGGYAVKAAQGAQDAATKAGQAVAGSTQSLARSSQNAGFKPGAIPGATGKNMFQIGTAKDGGKIKGKGYARGGAIEPITKDSVRETSRFLPQRDDDPHPAMGGGMGSVDDEVGAERRMRDMRGGRSLSGTRYNKGGSVKAGGATGQGRLQKRAAARAVPAKTEL